MRGLLLLWAMLWVALPGLAFDVVVTTPDGAAHPGQPTRLHVAAVDATGATVEGVRVTADGGTLQPDEDPEAAPGISAWLWTPDKPGTSRIEVFSGTESRVIELTSTVLPELDLGLPDRVDSPARSTVLLRLTAPDRPSADDLVVYTSEPTQIERTETADALELRLRPQGQGARVLLVTLSDRRRATRPQLVRVRLIDRPTLAFDVEPKASLQVRIGGRTYGPFAADREGRVRASVEQRPGERSAEILVSDDLGNVLATPYVLSALADPPMVVASRGDAMPGALPPDVLVYATSIDGRAWTGVAPTCRVPGGSAALPMVRLEDGLWRLAGAGSTRMTTDTLRLVCVLRDGTTEVRRRARSGVPALLDLRVGPDQISIDFPVAEVTAHLVDATGERTSADTVQVRATRGAVRLEPPTGSSRRGEYRAGSQAIVEGRDEVIASWRRPLGTGTPAGVEVGHGAVPVVGRVRVYGRAVDPDGRPLAGAPVRVGADGTEVQGVAGPDGWFSAELPLSDTVAPVLVEARSGARVARRLALRGTSSQGPGPDVADLQVSVQVSLNSGRASSIDVFTDTPVLYLRPDAQLTVRVMVLDRGGQVIPNEVPNLSVDHGRIGVVRPHPEGGYAAVYTPDPDASPRDVTITARAGSGTATGSTELRLVPPPITMAVGVGIGATTNFGAVTSPYLMVHLERRTFLEPVFIRGSVAAYGGARTVESSVATQRSRITLFPVALSGLYRPQMGKWQVWFGGTVQLVPYFTTQVLDGERLPGRQGLLPPGIGLVGGIGRRVRGGELMLELKPVFQSGSTASGFSGQLGGVASYVGYRAVFD